MATKRPSTGSRLERLVLSVAHVDWNDDRDGASFQLADQRRVARRLARSGYLKILSDERPETIAVLTVKGERLIASRNARLSEKAEIENLRRALDAAKRSYAAASDEYSEAKRDGPQKRINPAYAELGRAAAAFELAEQNLKAFERRHGTMRKQPSLLDQLKQHARQGTPIRSHSSNTPKKKRAKRTPTKLYRIRLVPRARGNLVDVKVNGRVQGTEPAGPPVLRAFRGIVYDLRSKDSNARFDLPGSLRSVDELVADVSKLYSWGSRRPRPL